MQAVASGQVVVDGGAGPVAEEIDVAASKPDGIRYYRIAYTVTDGSGVVGFRAPGMTATSPLEVGEIVQQYPQWSAVFAYGTGNPALIADSGTTLTRVGYTVYALTDEAP